MEYLKDQKDFIQCVEEAIAMLEKQQAEAKVLRVSMSIYAIMLNLPPYQFYLTASEEGAERWLNIDGHLLRVIVEPNLEEGNMVLEQEV